MTDLYCALMTRAHFAKKAWNRFLRNERGDTNFISIIIILAVVVALAGVFIGFGQDIIDTVSGTIDGFTAPAFPESTPG